MRRVLICATGILSLFTASCGSPTGGGADAEDPSALHVLAGSEIKDVEPQVKAAAARIGVNVVFENAGTLDVIDRANVGSGVDVAWVANGAYTALALRTKPAAVTKTMYSQVLVGVKPQKAHDLGWDVKAPTWAEIAKAAADGRFRYAMTSPAASNSGLSALVSVATSLTGKGDGLASIDVKAPELQGFLKGQALTAGSSGWLADAYARGNANLDGIINYESVLLDLNHRPGTRIDIIRPADGAVTSDYPLLLINPARRADYDKLTRLMTSTAMQKVFAASGRRPVDAAVSPSPELAAEPAIDLPFPARIDAVDALLDAYLDKLRRPVRSWFVLDRSGSMEGDRMSSMKQALTGLIAGDTSTMAGRYARLADRERTTLVTFSDAVDQPTDYQIDRRAPASRDAMVHAVSTLEAGGGTDLYDAVALAMRQAVIEQARDPGGVYSVVLMTDGEANAGMDADAFRRFYDQLPPAKQAIRVFPILFGEGNVDEMETIATMTGGRTFDARKGDLAAVFRDIRGYQ